MASSFDNPKSLKFIITLGTGTFGSSTLNQITLEGFRATANIDKAGGQKMGTLRAQIFGVGQSDMNAITTLQWKPGDQIKNTVEVYAIDGSQQTLVFAGNIVNAWGNYKNQPNVFLEIQAQAAYFAKLTPVAPLSFKGQIDVASVFSQLAGTLGLTFENNGVTTQMSDVYLAGTALDQVQRLATAAGVALFVDDTVLAICPPNTPRNTILIPQIGPTTGLKDYPSFDGVGVNFECYFNPSIRFGGAVQLVTSLPQAAGKWIASSIAYNLSCEKPDGPWFATVRGNATGLAVTK